MNLSASDLSAEHSLGLQVDRGVLTLAADAPSAGGGTSKPQYGIAESTVHDLREPSRITSVTVDRPGERTGEAVVEIRGRLADRWSEWRSASDAAQLTDITALQTRVTLTESVVGATIGVRGVQIDTVPTRLVHAAQATSAPPPTVRLWATRIGLVGNTTANGHVIVDRDHFVALPSRRALNRIGATDYAVQLTYRGRTATAPVWDIGPWNIRDDYWNANRENFADLPRWTSQAEAAYARDHNNGLDGLGRFITVPTSIDLADGTFWDDLGMTENDWIDVTFSWVDGPPPAARPTPPIVPKAPNLTTPTAPAGTKLKAASYNAPPLGSRVSLPLVTLDAGGWTSSITVQNASSNPTHTSLDLNGHHGRVGGMEVELPPWGSRTLSLAEVDGAPNGFVGSAMLSSTGSIAAIVNQDRPGADRASYEGQTVGNTSVGVPLVFKDYNGWSSGLQIHNLGATSTTARVTYLSAGSTLGVDQVAVAANSSATVYLPAAAAISRGFVGSALVQSSGGQPLAVVVNALRSDGAAMAYPAISGGAANLLAPILFKRYNGWETGLQLLNLGGSPSQAAVSYQMGTANRTETASIVPFGSVTLFQPTESLIAAGSSVASATITGNGPSRLVGIANSVQGNQPTAMSYVLGQPSATILAAPLVMRGAGGWDAATQIQNPGGAPATVSATLYDEGGSQVARFEETVGGGATRTVYLPSLPGVPDGFRGSAILQTSSNAGLVAVVNQTSR